MPIGLPGAGMALALDGLSGFFLLLLFLVGAAAGAGEAAPRLPPLLAALALTLLAGDGFALALGFDGHRRRRVRADPARRDRPRGSLAWRRWRWPA